VASTKEVIVIVEFNAEIELDISPDGEFMASVIDALMEDLAPVHGAVGRGPSDRLQVTMTLDAVSIEFATGAAWTLIHDVTSLPVYSFRAMPTAEFDRMYDLAES
jgi:hypothetical protein